MSAGLPTIAEVLVKHNVDVDSEWGKSLHEWLVTREDNMADLMRLAATQFGLYPEIVAKVLADLQMGAPITEEHKALIDRQFITLMERLQEEYRRQNPDGTN